MKGSAKAFSVLLLPKIIWVSNLWILSVPDEDYSRNASCALHLISTFSLQLILQLNPCYSVSFYHIYFIKA